MSPKVLAAASVAFLLVGLAATLATDTGQAWPWFATIPLGVSLVGFFGVLLWLLVLRLAKPDSGESGLRWGLRYTGRVVLCGCLLMASCFSCMVGTVSMMGTPPDDAQGQPMKRSDSSAYLFYGGLTASAGCFGLFLWVRRRANWS